MHCEDCGRYMFYHSEDGYCLDCKPFHTEEFMTVAMIKASSCPSFKWKPAILQVVLNRHCHNCINFKNHECKAF